MSKADTPAYPETTCGVCGATADDIEPVTPCPDVDCHGLMWAGGLR